MGKTQMILEHALFSNKSQKLSLGEYELGVYVVEFKPYV